MLKAGEISKEGHVVTKVDMGQGGDAEESLASFPVLSRSQT